MQMQLAITSKILKITFNMLILLALLPTVVCAGYREQRLGVVPQGYQLDTANIVFTADGSKVAFRVMQGEKVRVLFGDMVSKPYGHVRHVAISPDGRYVAHNGTPEPKGHEHEQYLVVNGVETGPFTTVCNPTFTPDSGKVIFEAEHGGKWHHALAVIGATVIAAETGGADIHRMLPVISPDGRLVVSIQQQSEAKKSVRLVSTVEMREVRRREYDSITDIAYSADRLRTAYVARRRGETFVVTSSFAGGDEREGAPFDAIYGLVISDDGAHVAYSALRGEKYLHLIDARESPAAFFCEGLPVFSRDGRSVVYRAIVDGKSFIAFAGRMISGYDDVSKPALSADGSILAFVGETQGQWRINVNGKETPAYDHVDSLQFTPGDKYLAFRAQKDGNCRMVIVDLQGKVLHEGPQFVEIWKPSFDEAGRLGYGALAGNEIWWKVLNLE